MVQNKILSKLRIFLAKLCKSNWINAWNLAFPVFNSSIVWNMFENLHYESVYLKEPNNDQEYYWPRIYKAGTAVLVSTITSTTTITIIIIFSIIIISMFWKCLILPCQSIAQCGFVKIFQRARKSLRKIVTRVFPKHFHLFNQFFRQALCFLSLSIILKSVGKIS